MALRLKRNGITRIRPLAGGLHLWMTREFPIQDLKPAPRTTLGSASGSTATS